MDVFNDASSGDEVFITQNTYRNNVADNTFEMENDILSFADFLENDNHFPIADEDILLQASQIFEDNNRSAMTKQCLNDSDEDILIQASQMYEEGIDDSKKDHEEAKHYTSDVTDIGEKATDTRFKFVCDRELLSLETKT